MNNQINLLLLEAVNNIAKEKNIDREVIRDFLIDSIKKAFTKSTFEDNLDVEFDLESGELKAEKLYEVVEDSNDFDEYLHILNTDPRVVAKGLKLGDIYREEYNITKEFKQQQVQQILQSFKQKIVEISNQRVYKSWTPMIGEVIMAEVEKEDKKGNFFTINLENKFDKNGLPLEPTLGFIGRKELNPLEELDVGKKYHFVISEVKEQSKFCPVILSRTSEKLAEYYMNLEIPEIDDGSIKIVAIARVAGIKTKVVVDSKTLLVEPAAVCVGPKGSRVKTISKLLGGEKVEIYNYNADPIVMITEVLDRSKMIGIKLDETDGRKVATIIVKDDSLPQVIGKRGSNAVLAHQITGWDISIITKEDADYEEIEYLSVNSEEYKNHFKKAETKSEDSIDLDILSLNDHDIDEIVNNAAVEEEFSYDLGDSDELGDLNEMFGDEIKNVLNDK